MPESQTALSDVVVWGNAPSFRHSTAVPAVTAILCGAKKLSPMETAWTATASPLIWKPATARARAPAMNTTARKNIPCERNFNIHAPPSRTPARVACRACPNTSQPRLLAAVSVRALRPQAPANGVLAQRKEPRKEPGEKDNQQPGSTEGKITEDGDAALRLVLGARSHK